MTDQNAIRDDIAFMRALAEQGQRGPLIGGAIMLAGGGLFGTASLIIWLLLLTGALSDLYARPEISEDLDLGAAISHLGRHVSRRAGPFARLM